MRLMIDSAHGLPEASSKVMEQYFRLSGVRTSRLRIGVGYVTPRREPALVCEKLPSISTNKGTDSVNSVFSSTRNIPSLIVAPMMMSVLSIGKNWTVTWYGFLPLAPTTWTGMFMSAAWAADFFAKRYAMKAKMADSSVAMAVIPVKVESQSMFISMASVFVSRLLCGSFNSSTGMDAAFSGGQP